MRGIGLSARIPVGDEAFDGVSSSFVFPVLNPETYFSECYRALTPGGLLSMSYFKPTGWFESVTHDFEEHLKRTDLWDARRREWKTYRTMMRCHAEFMAAIGLTSPRVEELLRNTGFHCVTYADCAPYGEHAVLLRAVK